MKDTTLRSVIFNQKDVEVVPGPKGMILKQQVAPSVFDSYIHTLKVMAQLSRIVYCDSGIIHSVMISPIFGTADNVAVNNIITEQDKAYGSKRTTLNNGARPNISYIEPKSTGTTQKIATYISTPSDVSCLFVYPESIVSRIPTLQSTDLIIVFKGSSTIKNFKHDLYSQFTPGDLASLMPSGTSMSSTTSKNFVTAAFVKPILKVWNYIKSEISSRNPSRVFITGHSLGGAYASLLTFILAECGRVVFPSIQSFHLVSFGSPTLLGDAARNTFNAHLDSGYVTLDRVTSYGKVAGVQVTDIVPSIPVGFSHPGFQPLRTEFYPETKTGRAYNIETVRKVFQTGGVFGIGSEKGKYETATLTHMPNKIIIPVKSAVAQAFSHAEYFDMTFFKGFRLYGMKNPGYDSQLFYANIFTDGIIFSYKPLTDVAVPDSSESPADAQKLNAKGGYRKMFRHTVKRNSRKIRRTRKHIR